MILCIDTITEFAGVALVNGKKAAYAPLPMNRQAETILPAVDALLAEVKKTPADLTGVLVISGPGSFTGLRVGIAVANQFAHQLQIPIIGLRTDEWWLLRTAKRPALYMQTLNRDEVYITGSSEKPRIEKVKDLYLFYKKAAFIGQLTPEHRAALPVGFKEIGKLKSVQTTWVAAAHAFLNKPIRQKTYALIEPFYGKEPTITRPKTSRI